MLRSRDPMAHKNVGLFNNLMYKRHLGGTKQINKSSPEENVRTLKFLIQGANMTVEIFSLFSP